MAAVPVTRVDTGASVPLETGPKALGQDMGGHPVENVQTGQRECLEEHRRKGHPPHVLLCSATTCASFGCGHSGVDRPGS